MRDAVEEGADVGVDDAGQAGVAQCRDAGDGIADRATRAIGEALVLEMAVEDRPQHQRRRGLQHAIADGRDGQQPRLAPRARRLDAQQRRRLVAAIAHLVAQPAQAEQRVAPEFVEIDAIDTGAAAVAAHARPGQGQRVFGEELVQECHCARVCQRRPWHARMAKLPCRRAAGARAERLWTPPAEPGAAGARSRGERESPRSGSGLVSRNRSILMSAKGVLTSANTSSRLPRESVNRKVATSHPSMPMCVLPGRRAPKRSGKGRYEGLHHQEIDGNGATPDRQPSASRRGAALARVEVVDQRFLRGAHLRNLYAKPV